MDRACDHSAMRSISHFQPFARAKGRSRKVPPFHHRNGEPLKRPDARHSSCDQSERPEPHPQASRRDAVTGGWQAGRVTISERITAGAVLRFTLAAGSPHGVNVHIVGVILILTGALGLLLPRIARAAPQDRRLRRRARPDQPRAHDDPPTANAPPTTARPPVQDYSMSTR